MSITCKSSVSQCLHSERRKRIAARTRQLNKPVLIDLEVLIQDRIKCLKDNSFVFLTYAYSKNSEHFTPYSFL